MLGVFFVLILQLVARPFLAGGQGRGRRDATLRDPIRDGGDLLRDPIINGGDLGLIEGETRRLKEGVG